MRRWIAWCAAGMLAAGVAGAQPAAEDAGPFGPLMRELEVEKHEAHEVFQGEKSLATAQVAAGDGSEVTVLVSAMALPGSEVRLLADGMSLERNGVPVVADPPLRHGRMERRFRSENQYLRAWPEWKMDPPVRPDDRFVFRGKGENVDIELAFTGVEAVDPNKVEEREAEKRREAAEAKMKAARREAARAERVRLEQEAASGIDDGDAETVVKCSVIGGQFFVPVAIEAGGVRRELVLAFDEKAAKTGVPASALPAGTAAGTMKVEVGGIAREMDVELLPAGTPGVLSPEVFAGKEHVLDAKGNRIVVRAANVPPAEREAQRKAKAEAMRAEMRLNLEKAKVPAENIAEDASAVAWGMIDVHGPRSATVYATLLELPYASAEFEPGSMVVTRNGVVLEGGEPLELEPEPRTSMALGRYVGMRTVFWDMGEIVRDDDVFVVTARTTAGLEVKATLKGGDLATETKKPRSADAGALGSEAKFPEDAEVHYIELDGREMACLWMGYDGDSDRERRMRHLLRGRWDCFLDPPKDGASCAPGDAPAGTPTPQDLAQMEAILDEIDAFAVVFDEAMEGNRALAAAEKTATSVRARRGKDMRLDVADWDFLADMANDAWYNEQSLAFIREQMGACRAKVAELEKGG